MTLATPIEGITKAGVFAKSVAVCDTQPVMAEGIRILLEDCPDLVFRDTVSSLPQAQALIRQTAGSVSAGGMLMPDVMLVDKAFGIQAILEWLADLRQHNPENGQASALPGGPSGAPLAVVVWGVSVTEAEALRFLQAGARGILRKTAALGVVLACIRTVAAGRSWMEDCVFRDSSRAERYPRSELTAREQQVLELVEQGCKNKEIALELGIRPGTVKIHLKHIFEKTGVRGRYGLALSGLKDRGLVSIPA